MRSVAPLKMGDGHDHLGGVSSRRNAFLETFFFLLQAVTDADDQVLVLHRVLQPFRPARVGEKEHHSTEIQGFWCLVD